MVLFQATLLPLEWFSTRRHFGHWHREWGVSCHPWLARFSGWGTCERAGWPRCEAWSSPHPSRSKRCHSHHLLSPYSTGCLERLAADLNLLTLLPKGTDLSMKTRSTMIGPQLWTSGWMWQGLTGEASFDWCLSQFASSPLSNWARLGNLCLIDMLQAWHSLRPKTEICRCVYRYYPLQSTLRSDWNSSL